MQKMKKKLMSMFHAQIAGGMDEDYEPESNLVSSLPENSKEEREVVPK